MARLLFSIIVISIFSGCNLFHKKNSELPYTWVDSAEYNWQDYQEEWTVSNEILFRNYKGSVTKKWDLIHTNLNLSFDFENRSASGKATLTLHPHWDSTNLIELDAKYLNVNNVWLHYKPRLNQSKANPKDSAVEKVSFTASDDSLKIFISLPRFVHRHENIQISIDYRTNTYRAKKGGNAAITDDKGLYFINHDLSDPTKPRQLWTQGETESSSRWFPTLDAPNQKTTLDITLEVPDTMVSLSNGTLVSSQPSAKKGYRTDHWVQTQPHAPYLTMIAMGNWAVVKDSWRGKQVNYLVEKTYEPYAEMIFGHTPQMIEFFSNYLGVPFAWDKYSQVVVRDFVSGAMENTSATVHMEELQHTPRQHIDNTYEDYVSHELFHQWFGDLVTTESWSNITLNESFATYGEYLWREFFYGRENALDLLEDLRHQYRYIGNSEEKHLVRYDWVSDGELFDNVSYQKGGCILHMLRYTVGDEAFRESLKRYLQKNRFGTAEVADLRMSFEEVTGQDLNWFFNQWYFTKGHPQLNISLESDEDGNYGVRVEQTQYQRNTYNFKTRIKYSVNGSISEKDFFVTNRIQFLNLNAASAPDWYIFDSDNVLLCDKGLMNANISDAQNNIEMMAKAWPYINNSDKSQLLNLANQILNEGYDQSDLKLFQNNLNTIFTSAVSSNNDLLTNAAMELYPYLSEELKAEKIYQDTHFIKIAQNNKLKAETRLSALYKMYYSGMPDLSLLSFTRDSSIDMSTRAIMLLHQPEIWVNHAISEGLNDQEGELAAVWARKLLTYNKAEPDVVLNNLAANRKVGANNYMTALNSVYYYTENSKQAPSLEKLASQLSISNNKTALSVLLYTIKKEIQRIDRELEDMDDYDPQLKQDLQSRKEAFTKILDIHG